MYRFDGGGVGYSFRKEVNGDLEGNSASFLALDEGFVLSKWASRSEQVLAATISSIYEKN